MKWWRFRSRESQEKDIRSKRGARQAASDGPAVPPELAADLWAAQKAQQRYLAIADGPALDAAVAAWIRIMRSPSFSSASERFQVAVLNEAGGVFSRRYRASGSVDDLDRALGLYRQAVKATPPNSNDLDRKSVV